MNVASIPHRSSLGGAEAPRLIATHSPTCFSARQPAAHDSCHSSCKRDAHASADCTSSREPVLAHPGADVGGDCHGDGVKLSFLVRHPLCILNPFSAFAVVEHAAT